jgi:hypothetical protein
MAKPEGDRGHGLRLDAAPALERWPRTGLLGQVPPPLVAMLRGEPTLILDTCSMRAKRAGDRTGPNPTDRGKRGIKDHIAVKADGIVLRLHREVAEATRRCGTVALVYGNGRVAARGLPGGMRGA